MSTVETKNIDMKGLKYQKYMPKSNNPYWCPGCSDYAILTCQGLYGTNVGRITLR